MSLFLPNIPQANDNLDFSQSQLLSNNQGLDTVFGIDHYLFSDATANKGFHNQVTTPAHVGGEPTTAASLPLLYSLNLGGNLGVIQFSKIANIANTTPGYPISGLQSPTAATVIGSASTTNVFDFSGLARAFCFLIAADMVQTTQRMASYVVWTGSALLTFDFVQATNLKSNVSGSILRLSNTSGGAFNNIYWTLQFMRVQ